MQTLWTACEIPLATTKKSYVLSLQVDFAGEWMTPFTKPNRPISVKSLGVQLKSPPRIHGPLNPFKAAAMSPKRSRLHLALIPCFV